MPTVRQGALASSQAQKIEPAQTARKLWRLSRHRQLTCRQLRGRQLGSQQQGRSWAASSRAGSAGRSSAARKGEAVRADLCSQTDVFFA